MIGFHLRFFFLHVFLCWTWTSWIIFGGWTSPCSKRTTLKILAKCFSSGLGRVDDCGFVWVGDFSNKMFKKSWNKPMSQQCATERRGLNNDLFRKNWSKTFNITKYRPALVILLKVKASSAMAPWLTPWKRFWCWIWGMACSWTI